MATVFCTLSGADVKILVVPYERSTQGYPEVALAFFVTGYWDISIPFPSKGCLVHVCWYNCTSKPSLTLQELPVTGKTYLFKELYIEPIRRNPKNGRSFPLQVGFRVAMLVRLGRIGFSREVLRLSLATRLGSGMGAPYTCV